MKAYKYKNIICFQTCGRWYADYKPENGARFGLHGASCRTRKEAYIIAKEEVDFLNERSEAK